MAVADGGDENLRQQLRSNTDRIHDLVNQQYNVEVTRSLVLRFSSAEEECAQALSRALFAKGMRMLQSQPEQREGRLHVRAGVKRSLRDVVREEFTSDLVHTAAAMNGSYDGWDLLTDDAAEQMQSHADAPSA